ncbi:hypothetical protein [Marinobacter segnicrescens]|uniref:hypothetical protein n=1 Tax=Marinobacter segnicrescens TaxID=430453 RepID=UPI003A92FFE8
MTAEVLPLFPRDTEAQARKVALRVRDHSATGLRKALCVLSSDDQRNALYVGLILSELDRRELATASARGLARQMISQGTPVEPRGFEAAIITAPAPQPAPRRAGLRDALTAAAVAGALALALVFGTSAAAKARADVAMYQKLQQVTK